MPFNILENSPRQLPKRSGMLRAYGVNISSFRVLSVLTTDMLLYPKVLMNLKLLVS